MRVSLINPARCPLTRAFFSYVLYILIMSNVIPLDQAVDLNTLRMAMLDAIENAERRGDYKSARVYNNIIEQGVRPALKEAYQICA